MDEKVRVSSLDYTDEEWPKENLTTCVVVLGMHGGGTSLVASILDAFGVEMHYNPRARIKNYLNYEDSEFVRMDARILHLAGGNWRNPPDPDRILEVSDVVAGDIVDLVASRSDSPLWGWKDPRSAITIPLYHSHLPDPHYVFVTRGVDKVARSIMSRSRKPQGAPGLWRALAQEHYDRIERFIKDTGCAHVTLAYEDLTHGRRMGKCLARLAEFLGVPGRRIPDAMGRIRQR